MRKHLRWCWAAWALVGAAFGGAGAAETQPPVEGADLPSFSLPAPKEAEHAAYLGVGGRQNFGIGDIASEVILIEIFNMY